MSACCSFRVGGRWFGLPVERVREVIRHPTVTPVPLAPPVVAGLINLRGEVLLALDLRIRLGFAPAGPAHRPVDLIFQSKDGAVSLLVDETGPVLELRDEEFEAIPETVPASLRNLLRGTYKMADRLLLVLDPDRVADVKMREAAYGAR
jgi:purine-binding chemotaxis protein CheW